MKRIVKIVAALGLLLIVLVVAAGLYVAMNVNSLAKRGIEKGGTYALGVPTTVRDVDLGILAGRLTIQGLNVANPQGFTTPAFLALNEGTMAVSLGSLRSEVIDVPQFKLSGVAVNLEKKSGTANYKVILDNLQKLKGSSGQPSQGSDKRLIVQDLDLRDIRIHVDMLGVGGPVGEVLNPVTKVDIPIDRVQLKNVGKTGTGVQGTGVTVEELTSIIVQAVLAAAAEKGGGVLPLEILNDLKSGVASLGDLAKLPTEIVGKAGEAATVLGETAAKAVEGAGEGVKKAADEIGKTIGDGLGNLIPGSKPKEPPKK